MVLSLSSLFQLMAKNDRHQFVVGAIKWSNSGEDGIGHTKLHQGLAKALWKGELY